MLQTVQFDTATDSVESVLDSIAKSYGYPDVPSAIGTPKVEKVSQPTRSRIEWRAARLRKDPYPSKTRSATAPWDISNTRNFLMEITPTSRKLFALMVVEGDVTAWQVTEFIGTQTLKGVFSSIGAAKSRTRGLVRARSAYMKPRRRDGFHYVMAEEFRDLFMDAFLSAGLDKLLEEAEQFIEADRAQPVGEAV